MVQFDICLCVKHFLFNYLTPLFFHSVQNSFYSTIWTFSFFTPSETCSFLALSKPIPWNFVKYNISLTRSVHPHWYIMGCQDKCPKSLFQIIYIYSNEYKSSCHFNKEVDKVWCMEYIPYCFQILPHGGVRVAISKSGGSAK